jgi:uncharacterized protein YcfJ
MKKTAGRIKGAALVVCAAATLAGCATTPEGQKMTGQIVGGATGAAVGSLFGSGTGKSVAIGVGAVMGTIVGGNVASQ